MTLPNDSAVEAVSKKPLAYGLMVLSAVVAYLFIDNRVLHNKIEGNIQDNFNMMYQLNKDMMPIINKNSLLLESIEKKINP